MLEQEPPGVNVAQTALDLTLRKAPFRKALDVLCLESNCAGATTADLRLRESNLPRKGGELLLADISVDPKLATIPEMRVYQTGEANTIAFGIAICIHAAQTQSWPVANRSLGYFSRLGIFGFRW